MKKYKTSKQNIPYLEVLFIKESRNNNICLSVSVLLVCDCLGRKKKVIQGEMDL